MSTTKVSRTPWSPGKATCGDPGQVEETAGRCTCPLHSAGIQLYLAAHASPCECDWCGRLFRVPDAYLGSGCGCS